MAAMKELYTACQCMIDDTALAVDHWAHARLRGEGIVIEDRYNPEDVLAIHDPGHYADIVREWCRHIEGLDNINDYARRFVHAFQYDPYAIDYDAVILDNIAQFALFGGIEYA